jgi:hypothetical protein
MSAEPEVRVGFYFELSPFCIGCHTDPKEEVRTSVELALASCPHRDSVAKAFVWATCEKSEVSDDCMMKTEASFYSKDNFLLDSLNSLSDKNLNS